MAKIKSKVEDEPADSFTSMIDVVFLLLIFFILQPFKAPEMKLRSELPKDQGPSSARPDIKPSIRLEIRPIVDKPTQAQFRVGSFKTNSETLRVDPNWICNKLIRESNGDKTTPVTIAPWTEVEFEHVLRALDQCYLAEMSNVNWESPPVIAPAPKKAK